MDDKIPLEIIENHARIVCGKCKGELDIKTCQTHSWILKTVCKKCQEETILNSEQCQECLGIINSKGEKINHYPGLECPYCSKWQVKSIDENLLVCQNCKKDFTEDDICNECNSLVKGSCYYCKMD